MSITSLTSFFNTASFGDTNASTRNQQELALTLDAAAQELANWKSLLTMSAGGGFFEGGRLAARVLLGATPALCAVPFLANAFTFAAGALADTGLTGILTQAFGNTEEEESFWARMMDQSSMRGMGLLGAGQSFAVVQILIGITSVSKEMVCGKNPGPACARGSPAFGWNGAFLHHLVSGLSCYFGSGMFTCLSGGVVNAVEQRISLRVKNTHPGVPLQSYGRFSTKAFAIAESVNTRIPEKVIEAASFKPLLAVKNGSREEGPSQPGSSGQKDPLGKRDPSENKPSSSGLVQFLTAPLTLVTGIFRYFFGRKSKFPIDSNLSHIKTWPDRILVVLHKKSAISPSSAMSGPDINLELKRLFGKTPTYRIFIHLYSLETWGLVERIEIPISYEESPSGIEFRFYLTGGGGKRVMKLLNPSTASDEIAGGILEPS